MIHKPTRRQFITGSSIAAAGAGIVYLTGCGGKVLPAEEATRVLDPSELSDFFTMENTGKKVIASAELPYLSSAQQSVIALSTSSGSVAFDQKKLGDETPDYLTGIVQETLGESEAYAIELFFEQPVKLIGVAEPGAGWGLVKSLAEAYKGQEIARKLGFKGALQLGRLGRAITVNEAYFDGLTENNPDQVLVMSKMYVLGPAELERRHEVPIARTVGMLTLE